MKKAILGLTIFMILGCDPGKNSNSVAYSSKRIVAAKPFAEGVISTKENSEFQIMFSPNGRKAYFSRRAPGEKQKIYETEFKNDQWSTPQISEFSTDRDETPSITPNGELFFFGSERAIPYKPNRGNFDMNVWMMKKEKGGWSEPQPLPYPINDVQIEGEEWPSSNNNFFSAVDNETFYFTTMVRGSSAIKLYQTRYVNEHFTNPIEISGIFDDEKYWVYSPVVSPDGNYLVFNSYGAPGGLGGEDIFVCKRTETGWSKAIPIGLKINSKDEESAPRFSRDGKYFFFNRAENLGNFEFGEWDIFYIETAFLNLEDLFK